MKFNYAFNKSNSFFKGRIAITTNELTNQNGEIIKSGSEITIISRSSELKVFFNISYDNRVFINNVSYESLELL